MKKILLITILAAILSLSLKAQKKPRAKTFVITYLHKEEGQTEVLARSGKSWFRLTCSLPDSVLKLGSVIIAYKYRGQKDAVCLFERRK